MFVFVPFPQESCGSDSSALCRAIASVHFPNAAWHAGGGTYKLARLGPSANDDLRFQIHHSSVLAELRPEWVVFSEVRNVSRLKHLCRCLPGGRMRRVWLRKAWKL
eukprot:GHVT01070120.1.p2 GENE.GHVT01070120.1~~GHVT01070120.1.p2  ORF type:complete len:106 (+),score=8.13 GHVT01070120.1:79-396(+)